MLFITHDLELAAAVCDPTAVMYAGQIVEIRASALPHSDPLHPYTAALTAARPDIGQTTHRLRAYHRSTRRLGGCAPACLRRAGNRCAAGGSHLLRMSDFAAPHGGLVLDGAQHEPTRHPPRSGIGEGHRA